MTFCSAISETCGGMTQKPFVVNTKAIQSITERVKLILSIKPKILLLHVTTHCDSRPWVLWEPHDYQSLHRRRHSHLGKQENQRYLSLRPNDQMISQTVELAAFKNGGNKICTILRHQAQERLLRTEKSWTSLQDSRSSCRFKMYQNSLRFTWQFSKSLTRRCFKPNRNDNNDPKKITEKLWKPCHI